MKFVLFRHAHKGFLPFEDPELSPKGLDQSIRIKELIKNNTLPQPQQLWISPKKRTAQTFYPCSKEFSITMQIQADLDQRLAEETSFQFKNRVQNFINEISRQAQTQTTVFACTHYDWIEEAMALINCDSDLSTFEFTHWSPTQFLIFQVQEDIWKIIGKGASS